MQFILSLLLLISFNGCLNNVKDIPVQEYPDSQVPTVDGGNNDDISYDVSDNELDIGVNINGEIICGKYDNVTENNGQCVWTNVYRINCNNQRNNNGSIMCVELNSIGQEVMLPCISKERCLYMCDKEHEVAHMCNKEINPICDCN